MKGMFDVPPLDEQPKFIADMGCGNGAFLKELYQLVVKHTARGEHLKKYPLALIGADYSEQALQAAQSNLRDMDCRAHFLTADISKPEQFKVDLQGIGFEIDHGLHIRSFLDHDRQVNLVNETKTAGAGSHTNSQCSNGTDGGDTGTDTYQGHQYGSQAMAMSAAYVDNTGVHVDPATLQRNLVQVV